MKNHFISLFEPGKRRKTFILLGIAIFCILVSLMVGTADNLPMIALLLAGLIVLYFAILHTWEKAAGFAILTAIFAVVLVLDFLWPFKSEAVAMITGFVCLAGVIAGIIGIFSRVKGWGRLPFSASLVSLLALGFLSTNLDNPNYDRIAPLILWILVIGSQTVITILLFCIGLINKREKLFTRVMLGVSSLILVLLCIWGFQTANSDFGNAVNSDEFARLIFRIIASLEIIIAALSLYALKKKPVV